MGGDEDDGRRAAFGHQPSLKIEAAQTTKVDVEDDAIWLASDVAIQEFLGRSEGLDADAIEPKCACERGTKGGIIVDDSNPRVRKIF